MEVTDIVEKTKSRSKIFIDDEFAFVLYKGELRIYKIKKNQEISESVYDEIMEKVLPKRAKLRCMNLLKSRSYTEKQLSDKLKQGDYPQKSIIEAIEYVKAYHYVNDLQYAKDYYEYQKEFRSRQRIKQDLIHKGITKEILEEIFSASDMENQDEEFQDLEVEQILKLLKKKKYDESISTYDDKRKIYAFLLRKGFSSDKIQHVMKIYNTD